MSERKLKDWQKPAAERLGLVIRYAQKIPSLVQLGPNAPWHAEVKLIGPKGMTELNFKYRKKRYATDVLSFPSIKVFRETGHLGDLVICLSVMKKQAKSLGQSADLELDILLIHGLLHLLGLDHEGNEVQAAAMAKWEAKLLKVIRPQSPLPKLLGLIDRSNSGT